MKGISNNLASASMGDNRYKTPLGNKQKAEYPTIQDCIDSIAENVDSKFFDKNKITTTVLQKTKSTYQELDKNQEDISKYKEQFDNLQKLGDSTASLYKVTQQLRESANSKEDNVFASRTIYGKDIEKYADISVHSATIPDLKLQINQLASAHQISSTSSFRNTKTPLVKENKDPGDSAIFTPGTFKIGIPNFPHLSATFKSKDTNITDTSLAQHIKAGVFYIYEKESGNNIEIIIKADDTLEKLKNKINQSHSNVKASIISENGEFRLLIQSKQPGPLNSYEIIDKKNILNDQFKSEDPVNGYKSYALVKLEEGNNVITILESINYHSKVTGVSASYMRVNDDEYKIFLKNDYTGAGTIVDLLDDSGCLGDTFSRNFEFNGSITSSVGFESKDSPVVYEYHQKPDVFTAGYITINGEKILLEKGDTLTTVQDKINNVRGSTNVTAEITENQGGDNKFRISLTYTGTAPEKVIKIKDHYMSLNSVFPSIDSASSAKYITNEATINHPTNAIIELNGQIIQRSHNTITDVFSRGALKIKLKNTTESPIHVQIIPDQEKIWDATLDFVTKYSTLLRQICKYGYDDSPKEGLGALARDDILKQISNNLTILQHTRSILDSIGISFVTEPEQTNDKGEFEPQCQVLGIYKEIFQKAINDDITKIEELFAFTLRSTSENFHTPLSYERKNVDFGRLIVDSIDYEVDFNKLEVISSQSKFVASKDIAVVKKDGNIIINNRNIKLSEGDSLATLAEKINKVFPKSKNPIGKNNEAQAEIEAKIIGSDGYNAILLELNQHQDLEIVDYDNILGDLFKAELPSFESILFDDENAAAVNKPEENNLNLLKEGTFKINDQQIQVSPGDTWKDIVQKINDLNIDGITAEIVPNAHRYQLKIQQLDNLDTKLRIHDFHEVTKGVIHAANTNLKTKFPSYESKSFHKDAIAVNKPKENYPDLLKEGTFKINNKDIRVSQGDTWQDIAQKINNLNLNGITAEIIPNTNRYKLQIKQDNPNTMLWIQDHDKITKGIITQGFKDQLTLFESISFYKDAVAVNKPGENNLKLLKEGIFQINNNDIQVSQGDTWQNIVEKINNLKIDGITIEIVPETSQYKLQIQKDKPNTKLEIQDNDEVIKGAITPVENMNDDKAKLFFDTTRVATAKVNTAADVIQKNTLFKITRLQSRPDKQLATIDIFNPANQPQNYIQCQVSYINFAEQLHIANDAKSYRKIKDHANVKIQQGIIDKIAVKIKDYSNLQFIAKDNIISNKMQQLQKKISESETKQQKLEKEADKKCKEVMVYIKQQETTYEMNKKMNKKLWGNSKDEL
ncbi:MAG: flagellar filament capping protein FliD [Candidatus Lariskella arthropodorum]